MHASYEQMQAIGGMLFLDHGWGSMIAWKTADSRFKKTPNTHTTAKNQEGIAAVLSASFTYYKCRKHVGLHLSHIA